MNCRQTQQAILDASARLPEEAAAHLQTCAECRAFAATFQHAMTGGIGKTPPPSLDRCVRDRVRPLLAARSRPSLPPPSPIRRSAASRWFAAAAALAMLFALPALLRHFRSTTTGMQTAGTPWSIPQHHQTTVAVTWEAANRDLETMSREMELAQEQVKDIGKLQSSSDAGEFTAIPGAAMGIGRLDDALLELECDLYFELRELKSDG